MSYPSDVCVAAVEALIVALLWITFRVRLSRVARPLVGLSGVSAAWGAWILVLVLRGPAWMMVLTISMIGLSSVAMAVAIHLATSEEQEERHGGGAGGVPRFGPEAPRGGGGDDEPVWWPEFERQFATYAARQDGERRPVKC